MSAEKPPSDEEFNDLAESVMLGGGRVEQTLLAECSRLKARERKLVEACRLGLRVIEELVATDTGVALVLRAAIEENDDGTT